MPNDNVVMISSTARDLPEHRQQVLAACLTHGFQPRMMEHLPASDERGKPRLHFFMHDEHALPQMMQPPAAVER